MDTPLSSKQREGQRGRNAPRYLSRSAVMFHKKYREVIDRSTLTSENMIP